MILLVDFNSVEGDGRVPALLVGEQRRALQVGARVVAADGEGTECRAIVREVSPDGRYAMLAPIAGTWRSASAIRPDLLTTQPG